MSQHDFTIANQGFPAFRADLNNFLQAVATTHSGTSTPSGAVAGTIWLDTTTATAPILKYYDGTDNITLATIDHVANTVNFSDSALDLLTDTTPQLGGDLDANGNDIQFDDNTGIRDDSDNEQLTFQKTASAVNELTITNSATGNAPELSATGGDTNIDLKLTPKGTGKLNLDGIKFPNADGVNNQILKTDGAGALSFINPPTGFRNRIINGNMQIDQRNAGASVTVNSTAEFYPVDRFFGQGQSADGVYTLQQSTTVPAGFSNSIVATVTTADTSIGATQYYSLCQRIEGFNTADLSFGTASAKTVTLSFWTRSSLTGTFGGALLNNAFDRSYPFTYSISVANTWEYKTITIAGDTSGTWVGSTNGVGLRIFWGLGVGSTYSGTAGAWAGSLYLSATGATSVIGTNGATFYITGVQLEAGTNATDFEFLPIDVNLGRCYRYFQKYTFGCSTSKVSATSTAPMSLNFKKITRASATVTVAFGNGNKVGTGPATFSDTIVSAYGPDESSIVWESSGDSTNTGAYTTRWTATISAEL